MNRSQEVAAWVWGLALAGSSVFAGHGFLFKYVIPILVIGHLAIYSLRTRDAPRSDVGVPGARVAAIILAVAVLGHLDGLLAENAYEVESLQTEVEDARASASEAKDAAEEAASKMDDLAIEIGDLRR